MERMIDMRKEIEILMNDGCTQYDAERHMKNGTLIYEMDEFMKNADEYLSYMEEKEEFLEQIKDGVAPEDWGIAEYEGQKYIIQYCL